MKTYLKNNYLIVKGIWNRLLASSFLAPFLYICQPPIYIRKEKSVKQLWYKKVHENDFAFVDVECKCLTVVNISILFSLLSIITRMEYLNTANLVAIKNYS